MTDYFDINYRKNLRKRLVDYIYNYLKNTRFPPDVMAFMIKAHHFTFPLATYFIFLYAPLILVYMVFFTEFIFAILYVYLHGCFISHLEYKLHKKKFINISDPILLLFNYPINKENQFNATLYAVIVYFISVIFILLIRNNYSKN